MAQLAAFWAKLTMLVSTIRFSDIVDILIVAYLIYNVIMLIRKTNSYRLAQGVLLILIALWLSGVLKLTMFNRILQKTVELGLIGSSSSFSRSCAACSSAWAARRSRALAQSRSRRWAWTMSFRRPLLPARSCRRPRPVRSSFLSAA